MIRPTNSNHTLKNMNDYLAKFTKLLDTEIKKIYLFFVNKERELYILINSHLHIRQSYESFDLKSIMNEYQELLKVSLITYNTTKFIDLNMMGLKKILKKFDKNFSQFYGNINLKYIQRKLDSKNSDLLYILQFKIIDEVNALLEDLMCDLKTKFESRKNSTMRDSFKESLLPQEDFHMTDLDTKVNTNKIITDLDHHINLIDEHNQNFRNNFKEWSHFLKLNTKTYNNIFSVTNNTSLNGISIMDNKIGYEQIEIKKNKKDSQDTNLILSEENNLNINLTLFHTFFFMFCYSVVLPTNLYYVKNLEYKPMLSGLIMSCTPIGTLISSFLTNKWIKTSYRFPMILSVLCFVIGNLLYSLANPLESIIPMFIGRIILGFGSNRVANRSYLIQFVPKNKLSKYLLYFQLCSLVGLATGPLFAIPILYYKDLGFEETSIFNDFTNPSIISTLFSVIFLILVIWKFSESLQSNFSIFKDNQMLTERSSSINSKDIMSKEEKIMCEEIDDKLSEINDKNQFSDTNLVAKSIEQIAWREKKTTSYLYKCFFVFMSVLFVCRFTTESLLIISPYYIHDLNQEFNVREIALLISGALFLVIPVGVIFNKFLNSAVRDRKMLIYLIISCIIFNILILNIFDTSIIKYSFIFVLLIISSNLLENVSTTMFSKIIPSDYEIIGYNAGFVIQITTMSGRVFGSAMLSIVGFTTDENINLITYGITLGLFVLALLLTIIYYTHLRVKAIARILRVRTVRKLKNSEF